MWYELQTEGKKRKMSISNYRGGEIVGHNWERDKWMSKHNSLNKHQTILYVLGTKIGTQKIFSSPNRRSTLDIFYMII